ncbi:RNA polymerase sigma factor [Ornithinibacillus sp. 179-J 7C1 HS]|uniref:RNA polymerase sigma factor n=1 Tax=Ornithinibacillus sp. 179-J 7C1 HS TaxID=3142384 RepID=UPI0039A0F3CA
MNGSIEGVEKLNYKQRVESTETLVERARDGDRDAFSELVRQYRQKAYGWAHSVTQDGYLAEDIVQDALIRAFLKLGTLLDAKKFQSWLRQIVRNEAYMKMRRGGPFRNEQPVSGISVNGLESIDYTNLDAILSFLSFSASEKAKIEGPEEHIIRLEMINSIQTLIRCLNEREKRIFEAYFFEAISPSELAILFDTSTANIYNVISRSRGKIRKEQIRIFIRGYTLKRAENGLYRKKILSTPPKF